MKSEDKAALREAARLLREAQLRLQGMSIAGMMELFDEEAKYVAEGGHVPTHTQISAYSLLLGRLGRERCTSCHGQGVRLGTPYDPAEKCPSCQEAVPC